MGAFHRLIVLVPLLVFLAAAAGGGLFAWSRHQALSSAAEQALGNARHAAEMAARSAALVRDALRTGDALLTDQIAAQAALLGVLAEQTANAPARLVAERLRPVVEGTVIEDATMRGLSRAGPEADPEARTITLPDGGSVTVSPARRSGADGPVVKRATATNADRTRTVGLTVNAAQLAAFTRDIGLERLVDDLLGARMAGAVWVLSRTGRELAHGAVLSGAGPTTPTAAEQALIVRAMEDGRAVAATAEPGVVSAAAPVLAEGTAVATVLLRRSAALPNGGWLLPVAASAAAALGLAFLAAWLIARAVLRQEEPIDRMAGATAALQAGRFNPFTLNDLCDRNDAEGRLARAFRAMAFEVTAREEALEAQLAALRAASESPPAPPPSTPPEPPSAQ